MEFKDSVLLLESFDEAFQVFALPSLYDQDSDNATCAMYGATHCLHISPARAKNATLDFADSTIEAYWNHLSAIPEAAWDYPGFDFSKGFELANADTRKRPADSVELKVARFMVQTGMDGFTFALQDQATPAARTIVVTNTGTGAEFIFSDIDDMLLYRSLREYMEKKEATAHAISKEARAAAFMA